MKFLFFISLLSLFLISCTSTVSRKAASLRFDQTRKSKDSSIKELQRRLSETASIAKAGPNGEIVFYYLSKEKIKGQFIDVLNIKVCKPYSVIEKGEDCVSIGKHKEVKVPYELYKSFLRSSIELAIEYSPTVLSADQVNKILRFAVKYDNDAANNLDLALAKKYREQNQAKLMQDALDKIFLEMDRDLKSKSVESVKFEDQKTIAMDLMKSFSRGAKDFPERVSGKLEELADYSFFDLAAWINWKSQYMKSVKQLDLVYMSETGLRFLLYAAFQQIKCSKLKTFTNTPCEKKDQYFLRHKLLPEIAFKTGTSYNSWMHYDTIKEYTLRLGVHLIDGVDSNAKLRRMTYEEAQDLNKHYKKQQLSLIHNYYERYVLDQN